VDLRQEEAKTLLKPNIEWKTGAPINRPAPFPFGKGGGIGPFAAAKPWMSKGK